MAFLTAPDVRKFRDIAGEFPRTLMRQLPPHLTVLDMIFCHESEETLVETVGHALRMSTVGSFTIRTSGVMVWHNLKYRAYSIALSVEPSEELICFRMHLERSLVPITIPEQQLLWFDYMPHVTMSLSVGIEGAQQAKALAHPPRLQFGLDSLDLLRHGGDYSGYSRVREFRLG